MDPSRWKQIEELYHAALECEPGERAALLARADPVLRGEVESLLAQDSSRPGALDRPAWAGVTGFSVVDSTTALITPGTQLGPYKIEGPLAAGGTGQVFRGVDTRLGRPVAVKTLREQFSARFDREARAISSLNHPHICTLYDVGPNYLVMELCEGETVAARLKRGKLTVQETLRYGAQIADALSAAHARGITHRDLKPGNIMLSKAGIKVLDFGLAKSPQDLTLTGSRMVMGTPAYMPPEQREGKECDARTDIYSLGLVLYEMVTGKLADEGQMRVKEHLPDKLAHVIECCLAPEPEDRWQSVRDVKAVLEWAAISPDGAWAVYHPRTESGIYVQPLMSVGLRRQIANNGSFMVWRKDGKEIMYLDEDQDQYRVWSVRVDGVGTQLRFAPPEPLFSVSRPLGMLSGSRPIAVSRDGSRIYFLQSTEEPDSGVIHVRTRAIR